MRVKLLPLGRNIEVAPGAALDSILSSHGVEFPCGGAGICHGCRVRVLEGSLSVTPEMQDAFTPAELAAGWRLACCSHVEGPVAIEIEQWVMPILADDSPPVVHEPADGIGIAIDLGTTTLALQAIDLRTAEVLAVETALNPQAAHGADVMSRIEFALRDRATLTVSIREALGEMIQKLPRRETASIVMLAGNTAMHHLFSGIDVAPLASVPFRPVNDGEQIFSPKDLGWDLPQDARVDFLPCLGGFVGSDLLAGIIATGISESHSLCGLIDLGTNGEIVLGNAGRILCASTAAGPAFEAGRIRMGMRAAAGAIAHVKAVHGTLACHTIGDIQPRGICGSGLVEAVAAGLDLGAILPNGRLADGAREWTLEPPVSISQSDIRELQLAKGAIAAGLRLLLDRWGAKAADLEAVYLAGAFGNYLNIESARRIGLLDLEPRRITGGAGFVGASIVPAGNTSLRGVKMALLCPSRRGRWIEQIKSRTEHVPLASDPAFMDTFMDCLALPDRTAPARSTADRRSANGRSASRRAPAESS